MHASADRDRGEKSKNLRKLPQNCKLGGGLGAFSLRRITTPLGDKYHKPAFCEIHKKEPPMIINSSEAIAGVPILSMFEGMPELTVAPQRCLPHGEIYENLHEMNRARWDRYVASIQGTKVLWMGQVLEVYEKTEGSYELWIDMRPAADSSDVYRMDVYIVRFEVERQVALGVDKESQIWVAGTIGNIDARFGLSVQLVDGSIQQLQKRKSSV
jgi:hypothetical protein